MNIEEFIATIVPIISSNIATIIGCVVIIIRAVRSIKGSHDENTEEIRRQNKILTNDITSLHKENLELKRMLKLESYKRLNIKEATKDDLHKKN